MDLNTYFFDTYALVEMEKGNPNYKRFINSKIITTKLNLMELYAALIRDFNEELATKKFRAYLPNCISISNQTFMDAVKFRINSVKKLKKQQRFPSYIDCIGYIIALKLGIRFLTGDSLFKDLKNVEYIK